MRNRALHDALRDFALEAAASLAADLREGAELTFDVVAEPGTGSVLYRYEPLTSEFIAERWDGLRQLPACTAAAQELAGGAALYLRVHGGAAGDDSEPALRAMLERLYADATNFDFPEERFERVYAELEQALYESTVRTAIVAPALGLSLEHDRVDLGDGLFLVTGDKLDAPGEIVWPADRGSGPNVLCVLRRDVEADAQLPLAEATRRFRLLISALRVLKAGGVALGPVAYGRVDDGLWRPLPIPGGGLGRHHGITLAAAEEPELRELLELLAGPATAPVAWALARFEIGLDRTHDTEALSDYLLVLSSLFEVDDDAGRATLPRRLAALCAEARERAVVRRRVERAFALETRLKAGALTVDAEDPDTPRTLALELEECLRALLRDVVCGYLERNLKTAADDVLVTSGEPVEIAAADLRRREPEPAEDEPEAPAGIDDPLERAAAGIDDPLERVAAGELPREEPAEADAAARDDEPPPAAGAPAYHEDLPTGELFLDEGVTHSADWDDDASNWSAPV